LVVELPVLRVIPVETCRLRLQCVKLLKLKQMFVRELPVKLVFCLKVLVNALLSAAGGDGGQVTDRAGEGRSFCEASLFNNERIRHGSQGLPTSSVLSRILQTQMLDTLDIEGLYPLYRRVEQHLQDFPEERTRLQIDGPYDQNFLEKVQKCWMEDDGSVEYAAAKVT
ncbi:hypothetical protein XENOCAPTIV_025533, partial [Xenoophorus captivus]